MVSAAGRNDCDLTYPLQIARLVRREKPDVIVNAAAWTAVERAEADPVRAMRINAEAAGELAALAAARALMVHYSSDHVFDGAKSAPYVEDDEAAPLNMYGRSKLAGERAVQAANPAHLIFRASWVYGVFGHSFLKSMLMALRQPEACAWSATSAARRPTRPISPTSPRWPWRVSAWPRRLSVRPVPPERLGRCQLA